MLTESQIIDNLVHNRKWHDCASKPVKSDVAKLTQAEFYKIIDLHDQLILEQRRATAKLKHSNHILETALRSKNRIIRSLIEVSKGEIKE